MAARSVARGTLAALQPGCGAGARPVIRATPARLRQCPASKLAGAALPGCAISSTVSVRTAATAASVQSSNLPPDQLSSIQREASLPNADPGADSQTATLVNDQAPWMVPTYVRPPPMMAKGEGCRLWDVENRSYLDFTAGIAVAALGHADPEVTRVIQDQSKTLLHCSNLYHNPWIGLLSKRLVEETKNSGAMRDVARAFICNSGSEANEAAIKFARKVGHSKDPSGKKKDILSFNGSFHGRTMGALSATPNPKYQAPFAPMIPGFSYGAFNDEAALEHSITDQTCGVIIEPIQGEGGVNVATPSFLRALRARCDAVGAVLIYDEIQCGLGRTGALWAHGADTAADAPHPDILSTAKALGNGIPVGATLVTQAVSAAIATGDHGTTFGGNPFASRVAHHMVGRLADPALLAGVRRKEALFRELIDAQLARRFPGVVAEVRGRGLILGIQLAADPTPVVTAARERGLLVITCGTNTLRLVPPLIVSEDEIREGMGILAAAMESVFGRGEAPPGTRGQQEMSPPGSKTT